MGRSFGPDKTQTGKSKADKVGEFLARSRQNQAQKEKLSRTVSQDSSLDMRPLRQRIHESECA